MSPPKQKAPAGTEADAQAAIQVPESLTRTGGSAPAILFNPTTTRTCAGPFCWCHTGNYLWTYDHRQFLDTLARDIRTLEISAGPS